jgi:hypothetical protein
MHGVFMEAGHSKAWTGQFFPGVAKFSGGMVLCSFKNTP